MANIKQNLYENLISSLDDLAQKGGSTEAEFIFPSAKALIIVDDRLEGAVLGAMLAPWQLSCEVVTSSEEALEKTVYGKPYAIIMISYDKSDMPYLMLAKAIKTRRPAVLALLGNSFTEEDGVFFDANLLRPYNMQNVKTLLENNVPFRYRKRPGMDASTLINPSAGIAFSQSSASGGFAAFGGSFAASGGSLVASGGSFAAPGPGMVSVCNDPEILAIFAEELIEFTPKFKDLFKENIDLFRTKVHGVKSSSKQLGYASLGEKAEILEMCVKADNLRFAESHLDDFINTCQQTIDELKIICKDKINQTSDEDNAKVSLQDDGKKWILIVDDSNSTRAYLKSILAAMGFDCDTADSGTACLEMLQTKRYSLVMLDYLMPDMNGMGVLHAIRKLSEEYAHIPVLAVSGNISSNSKEEFKAAGFNDFVSKPVNATKLEALLNSYLK